MTKRNNIIYWVSTAWLALAMLASGLQQVFQTKSFVNIVVPLGYPLYFLSIIGFWKIAGVIAILKPKSKLLKEWAYAGFFFVMSGAMFSHIVAGSPVREMLPSLILLVMTIGSWYFRPANRRIVYDDLHVSV